MNIRLTELWLKAHTCQTYGWPLKVNKITCEPTTVIETLKFVYNCFGLSQPLEAPTKEQIDEYFTSKSS